MFFGGVKGVVTTAFWCIDFYEQNHGFTIVIMVFENHGYFVCIFIFTVVKPCCFGFKSWLIFVRGNLAKA